MTDSLGGKPLPPLPPIPTAAVHGETEEQQIASAVAQEAIQTDEAVGKETATDKKVNILCGGRKKHLHRFQSLAHILGSAKDLTPPMRQAIHQKLRTEFEKLEFEETPHAWTQRADLLDAIDVLHAKDPVNCPLLTVGEASDEVEWHEQTAPLVPYGKVKEATAALGRQELGSKQELGDSLAGIAKGEYSGTSKIVDKATRIEGGGMWPRFMKMVAGIMTRFLGLFYKKPPILGSAIKQIAKFSLGMHIGSAEVTEKREVNVDGKIEKKRVYRGPKHLFGKSVHEYKTVNEWFARDLTPSARADYVRKAVSKEARLAVQYGESEGSQVAISNSDARLRFVHIAEGKLGEPQFIAGKVLNPDAEAQAASDKDNARYYTGQYEFSVKNLFARTVDDPMGFGGQQVEDKRGAQHELLGAMYRAVEGEGEVEMVVQRLAPADVHNYTAPLDGTPLSGQQALQFLAERLEGVDEDEKAHLEGLMQYFDESEPATIEIAGTMDSVAQPAILNRSNILAQNDRKVMLLKHDDGGFSVHVFIGATGVNQVNVDESTDAKKRGDRQGDMQFGTEATKGKLKLGEWAGGFPINGSTVVSLYHRADMARMPKMAAFTEKARFKTEAKHGHQDRDVGVEVLAQMGNPIMIKADIRAAQLFEKGFGEEFIDGDFDDFVTAFVAAPQDSSFGRYLQNVLQKDSPSRSEQRLIDGMKEKIQKRQTTLKMYRSFIQSLGADFKPADFDDVIAVFVGKLCEGIPQTPEDQLLDAHRPIRALLAKPEQERTLNEKIAIAKFQKQVALDFRKMLELAA